MDKTQWNKCQTVKYLDNHLKEIENNLHFK